MEQVIVKDEELYMLIVQKLKHIVQALKQSHQEVSEFSLLCGKSGIALFLFEYSSFAGDEDADSLARHLLEISIEEIGNSKHLEPTHCHGFSGTAWALDYMHQQGHLVDNSISIFGDDLRESLKKQANNMLKRGNYDFLHGACGILLYLLDSGIDIDESVEMLISLGEESSQHFKWESWQDDMPGSKTYNMSLAHGQVSLLHVLIKAYEQKPNIRWLTIIEKSVKFIMSTKIQASDSLSVYPNFATDAILTEVKPSRLAWCYGDLGVANILYNASELLENSDLKSFSSGVLSRCASRKTFEQTYISDVFFCHGSSGLSTFFAHLFYKHQDTQYRDAALHWLGYTLDHSNNSGDLAGFKFNKTQDYQRPFAVLEGISGVGLSMLGLVGKEPNNWHKFFIL
jgi:lantibiotic modifying enzyme